MAQQNWLRGRTLVYNPAPKPIPHPPRFRIGHILLTALRKTCTVIFPVYRDTDCLGRNEYAQKSGYAAS